MEFSSLNSGGVTHTAPHGQSFGCDLRVCNLQDVIVSLIEIFARKSCKLYTFGDDWSLSARKMELENWKTDPLKSLSVEPELS